MTDAIEFHMYTDIVNGGLINKTHCNGKVINGQFHDVTEWHFIK